MTESSSPKTEGNNKTKTFLYAFLSLTVAVGCGFLLQRAFTSMGEEMNNPYENTRREVFEAQVGKAVEKSGVAQNETMGATLKVPQEGTLYLDNVSSWPNGMIGKTVVVKGRLQSRNDLPVFVLGKGNEKKDGIAVPPGTDLKKASLRYVLENPTWNAQ